MRPPPPGRQALPLLLCKHAGGHVHGGLHAPTDFTLGVGAASSEEPFTARRMGVGPSGAPDGFLTGEHVGAGDLVERWGPNPSFKGDSTVMKAVAFNEMTPIRFRSYLGDLAILHPQTTHFPIYIVHHGCGDTDIPEVVLGGRGWAESIFHYCLWSRRGLYFQVWDSRAGTGRAPASRALGEMPSQEP